jgi:hypothetical protein
MLYVLAKRNNAIVIHPEQLFFDKNTEVIVMDKAGPLYRDDDYLSTNGSHYLATIFFLLFL